jgi:hypothetical protein
MKKPQRGPGSVINHRLVGIILCNHTCPIEELSELIGKTKTQTHAYIQYLRTIGIAVPSRVRRMGKKIAVSSPQRAKPSLPTRRPEIAQKSKAEASKRIVQTRSNTVGRPAVENKVNPETVRVRPTINGQWIKKDARTWIFKPAA